MSKIVLASSNAGKVAELQALLSDYQLDIVPQSHYHVTDAEETGTTFVENAIIKARHASQATGLPAIADDSGLAVDFLGGAPGIYSARYSGEHGHDQKNNEKLLAALSSADDSQRQASFHCVLVYMRHADDPTPLICHGQWSGRIAHQIIGDHGFGYDPLFYPNGYSVTSAQLSPEQKNQISHRAQALKLLVEKLAGHH
ncbi:RdgB/HAM1 family non-canonical purine NTP pyrophosphatase [Celerinatantimonas sp. YJH-8]|uniref:RdgB/HAM1 family non-canonical purine NTP pyrophosphatase n=1 Tax=Celerinatantimonas sp. YJH-8 TaxID=3228714 RepID=UPI0038C8070E